MKRLAFALGLAILSGSPALSQTDDDRTLTFGCSDLVIVGRLKNGDSHASDDADDILGHGWANATVSVRRVVRGTETRSKLPVRYFAHTYMRDDRDFMLVLSTQPDGVVVIRTGQLMSAHPKLAARCEYASAYGRKRNGRLRLFRGAGFLYPPAAPAHSISGASGLTV